MVRDYRNVRCSLRSFRSSSIWRKIVSEASIFVVNFVSTSLPMIGDNAIRMQL